MLSLARAGLRRATAVRYLHAAVPACNTVYKANTKDMLYVLNDVMGAEKHYAKRNEDASPDMVKEIIDNIAKFSEQVLVPINASGDSEGCTFNAKDHSVKTPKGYKEAYKQYAEQGWQSLTVSEEYGGQGLPLSLGLIKSEVVAAANWSFGMYPGLAVGCMNTLILHGSEEMKQTYLTKLAEGTWLGTMCLTEPQCGTDLSQVACKAVDNKDGTFKLTGNKIFISCGEHDFTENIVHIVLARKPDAPPGLKGISLFLVPKYLVKSDGTLDKKLNIKCGGLENKMGIKASATCEMVFEDTIGYQIGEDGRGLNYMFTFMNTARLGTALHCIHASELAYQGAMVRALERRSLFSISGRKDKDAAADRIIHHPDVRRMLLTMRAITEGARAMVYETALLSDDMMSEDKEVRDAVDREMGLMTPILKGFLTELGLESASHGMQVWGGHGYIKGNGMEQIYRDARIGTMYEGTTGIQALDLLGRKLVLGNAKGALVNYSAKILSFCSKQLITDFKTNKHKKYALSLAKHAAGWVPNTAMLAAKAGLQSKDIIGSASVDYMMYSGYIVMGYWWLRMMDVSQKKLHQDPTGPDADFHRAKINTGKFYFERILPRASYHREVMQAHSDSTQRMRVKEFTTGL